MKHPSFCALGAVALLLSACSGSGNDDASISGDEAGGSKIAIGNDDENGSFSIETDGFSMEVDLPKMSIDSDDFDLNNVGLYPGSKVTGFDIEDQDDTGGQVTLSFVSPQSPDKLADWYEARMEEENFKVSRDGNSLSGTTDEGDPFSLELEEKSGDETAGELVFSER